MGARDQFAKQTFAEETAGVTHGAMSWERPQSEVRLDGMPAETGSFSFLWLAADELPLHEELIPFLSARSGVALEKALLHPLERRLGRALTDAERASVYHCLGGLGADRLGDVVLDLAPAAL